MKSHREHIKLNVIPDPRDENAKARDFKFGSVAAVFPISWTVKPQSSWRKYALRNQDGSGSCVSQGSAKALETKDKVVYSAHPIYAKRSNYPAEGMWLQDAGDILKKLGTTTEALAPSQMMNEQQMDTAITVPTPKTIGGYGFVTVTDLDAIANAIDTYGGCPIAVAVAWDEWNTEQGVPKYIPGAVVSGSHCLCAVDYTMYNNEKAIVVENSWGADSDSLNHTGQVLLTQSFLNGRGQQCMFFIPPNAMPTYKYFSSKEVAAAKLQPQVFAMLDAARGIAGVPFVITSGLRTAAENQAVGGEPNSAHLRGLAADLACTNQTRQAMLKGLLTCGVPVFLEDCPTHIHVDLDSSIHPLGDAIISTNG